PQPPAVGTVSLPAAAAPRGVCPTKGPSARPSGFRARRGRGVPWWAGAALALFVGAPALAQEAKPVDLALGYAIVRYLEAPLGYSPFGVYAAASAPREPLGFEVEAGYHHDTRNVSGVKAGLNTLTAAV